MTPVTQPVQWNVSGWRLKLKQTICSGATSEVESFQLENQHISRVKCVSRVHYSTGGTVLMAGLTAQLPHRDPQLWAWLAPQARDCQGWQEGGGWHTSPLSGWVGSRWRRAAVSPSGARHPKSPCMWAACLIVAVCLFYLSVSKVVECSVNV